MQTFASQQPESSGRVLARTSVRRPVRRSVRLATASGWVAAQLLLGLGIAGQAPAASAPSNGQQTTHSTAHPTSHAAAHSPTGSHHKPASRKTTAPPIQAQVQPPAPVIPAPPPPPNWPANNKAVEATVVWDSRGLLVQASNSSLNQILNDISLKIGAKVEGTGADERVFGTYGPGAAREVLTQLLDGTGYNILMVGDQGAGTPRKIVLSGRPNGPAPPRGNSNTAFNNDNEPEGDPDIEQRPPEPNPVMPPTPGAPGMPRTPQQMQQLMEERQRRMQPQVPADPQN